MVRVADIGKIVIGSFLTLLLLLSSCSTNNSDKMQLFSIIALDTINQIQFYPSSKDHLDYQQLAEQTEQQLQQIEQWFDAYDSDSSLGKINSATEQVTAPEIIAVLDSALAVARLSGGAYDPTIRPLVKLWDIGGVSPRVPAAAAITAALRLVDYRQVKIDRDNNRVSFALDGMALDLGSIAKGYAGDLLASSLQQQGVKVALINLGGNVLLIGNKIDGSPWRVRLRSGLASDDSDDLGAYSLELAISRPLAVATSGIYERFFRQDGRHYHHLLDSRTGYPVDNSLASVTVFADSSIAADAFSTALFVLGEQRGKELAEKLGLEVIFVGRDGQISYTAGISSGGAGKDVIEITRIFPGYRLAAE